MKRTLIPRAPRLPSLFEFPRWEVAEVMDRLFGPMEEWRPFGDKFTPEVNLIEHENDFEVTVDLPGLKPEDVKVELLEGRLWISGEKKEEQEEEGKTFHRVERRFGEFRRVLPLPAAVDEGKVEARFENGVLRVTVAKSEAAKPKAIEIKA